MKILSVRPWQDWQKEAILSVEEEAELLEEDEKSTLENLIFKADFMLGSTRITPKVLARSKTLKLIHVTSTGVDRYMTPEFIESDIVLINSRGVHGAPVADHAMALLLSLTQDIHVAAQNQQKSLWSGLNPVGLEGKTVGLLGLGAIGQSLARRCGAFGLKVLGMRRDASRPCPYVDEILGLHEILSRSDFVICSLPLTRETKHILSKEAFSRMKKDSYFINVGRGPVVDEKSLIPALKEGKIKGAGLDVFQEEPLPSDSPLWKMPNVIITPHSAGDHPENRRKTFEIFVENLKRWKNGEPLLNVVDKSKGY